MYFVYQFNYADPEKGIMSNDSWEKFLSKCGFAVVSNGDRETVRRAKFICENSYISRTFLNWEGYVIRVED